MHFYQLNGEELERISMEDGALEFAKDRRVALTEFAELGLEVSTVFLVFDHSLPGLAPRLFETMVFRKDGEPQIMDRYSTFKEARDGHAKVCRSLMREIKAG